MTTRSKNDSCANCGEPVSRTGPTPKSGKRYCQHPDCRRARNADRAQTARIARDATPAPEACAGCGDPMPARPRRRGDEFGRWCDKAKCRSKRRRLEDQISESVDLATKVEKLETVVEFLTLVVMCDNEHHMQSSRVHCRACGLTTAIPGWIHPDENRGGCEGTLDGFPFRNYGMSGLVGAWPFPREYVIPSAAEPEVADSEDTRTVDEINAARMAERRAAYYAQHPDR